MPTSLCLPGAVACCALALLPALPLSAQEDPPGERRDLDDDDLLDPDAEDVAPVERARPEAPAEPAAPPPPSPEQRRLTARAAQLAAAANALADELETLRKFAAVDAAQAQREATRRAVAAEERLAVQRAELARLIPAAARPAPGPDPLADPPLGYGEPLALTARPPRAPERALRPEQLQQLWWEHLLAGAVTGLDPGRRRLAAARASALKLEADTLCLSTPPALRAYADSALRQAIGASRLGQLAARAPRDARVDELYGVGKSPAAKDEGKPPEAPPIEPKPGKDGKPVIDIPLGGDGPNR